MFRSRKNEVCGSGPRALELGLAAEGEDVVLDVVLLAVVLVEAAGAGAVDEVVLHHDAAGALVGIEAPAAVAAGVTMMSWKQLSWTRVPGDTPKV